MSPVIQPSVEISGDDVARVADLLVRFRMAMDAANCAGPGGVTMPAPHQVRTMINLAHRDGHTLSELAERLGVSLGWASRIVDELEQSGHVVRRRDPDDRRVVRVWLSPETRPVADVIYAQRIGALRRALEVVAPDERPAVERFLGRLVEEFERLADPAP
jgi:DNA-binding MarR family transcriptional regulator